MQKLQNAIFVLLRVRKFRAVVLWEFWKELEKKLHLSLEKLLVTYEKFVVR